MVESSNHLRVGLACEMRLVLWYLKDGVDWKERRHTGNRKAKKSHGVEKKNGVKKRLRNGGVSSMRLAEGISPQVDPIVLDYEQEWTVKGGAAKHRRRHDW